MNDHRSLNEAVRAARSVTSETRAEVEPHEGDVGIGRGGAAGAPRVIDDFASRFNSELRAMSGYLRGRYPVNNLIANR